jgi:MFS family permease
MKPSAYSNIRLFYVYIFLNRLEMWLPVIVLFLLDRGFSLTQYAIVDAVWYVSTLAFEVPTGVVTDRCGKKASLLIGVLAQALALFLVAVGRSFPSLLIGYVLWGFANSFETGTHAALVYDSLKQIHRSHEYRKVIGRVRTLSILAAAIGSVAAGYLGSIQLALPILLTGVIALSSAPLILRFVEPDVTEARERSHLIHIWESVRFVVRRRDVRLLILYSAIAGTTVWGLHIFYQPLFKSLRIPVERIGWLYLFFRLTAAAGAYVADSLYARLGRTLIWAIPMCLGLSVFAMGLFVAPWVVAFVFAIFFVDGLYYPIVSDLLNKRLPSGKRATIISLGSFLACVMGASFYPLLGRVADTRSLQTTFLIMGAATLLLMTLVVYFLRRSQIEE